MRPSGIFTLLSLDEPDLVVALAEFGRRELAGHHPWATAPDPEAGPDLLAQLRTALAAVRPTCGSYAYFRDACLRLPDVSAWATVGLWRFLGYAGPAAIRDEPAIRQSFLRCLREVLGETSRTRPRYLADAVEEPLIRACEPEGGPLWRIVPVRPSDLVERIPPPPGAE